MARYFVRNYISTENIKAKGTDDYMVLVIDTIKENTTLMRYKDVINLINKNSDDFINCVFKSGEFIQCVNKEITLRNGYIRKENDFGFIFYFNNVKHYVYFARFKSFERRTFLIIIDGKIQNCISNIDSFKSIMQITVAPNETIGIHLDNFDVYFDINKGSISVNIAEFSDISVENFIKRYKNFTVKELLRDIMSGSSSTWMPTQAWLPYYEDLLLKGYQFNNLTKSDIHGIISKWGTYLKRQKNNTDFDWASFCKTIQKIKQVIPDITSKEEDILFVKYAFTKKDDGK